ncbi:MAG: hypothetical protein ACI9TF_001128, partial [Paracrocinitomix sp.]
PTGAALEVGPTDGEGLGNHRSILVVWTERANSPWRAKVEISRRHIRYL